MSTNTDLRPHSRACGIQHHEHGSDCHSNCPTCGGHDKITNVVPVQPVTTTPGLVQGEYLFFERVSASDLKVGDVIAMEGEHGEYIDCVTEIVEYAVHMPPRPDGRPPFNNNEANGRCLCIRQPQLNSYRGKHNIVRRLVAVRQMSTE